MFEAVKSIVSKHIGSTTFLEQIVSSRCGEQLSISCKQMSLQSHLSNLLKHLHDHSTRHPKWRVNPQRQDSQMALEALVDNSQRWTQTGLSIQLKKELGKVFKPLNHIIIDVCCVLTQSLLVSFCIDTE